MYKIPNLPSPEAYIEEKADFWEVQTLKNNGNYYSQLELLKGLSIGLDELSNDGIENEGDKLHNRIEEVFIELKRRSDILPHRYPFEFERTAIKLSSEDSIHKDVYLYLLLCTRFNMLTKKVHAGIDGTLVFERLCADVSKNYFGNSSDSFVFGTAEPGNIEDKIKHLVSRVGEGGGFRNRNRNTPTANDDAVDIVVWKEFSDKHPGKLIGFGQCKTGTSWNESKDKLKPESFCKKWLEDHPIVIPISMFFICDTLIRDMNFHSIQMGYLFFNRFRIMEYLPKYLDPKIVRDIRTWLSAALIYLNNPKRLE